MHTKTIGDFSWHIVDCLGPGRRAKGRGGANSDNSGGPGSSGAGSGCRGRPRRAWRRGGAGAAAGGGASEFYNYDTTAASEPPIPDGPPAETHQKITLKGETLAYTARAGYLPLRNATTGQSEAHVFFTCYAKDGVSDAAARP